MKALSKILVAVWLLGAVDANAELKKLTFFWKALPGAKPNNLEYGNQTLEIKGGEVLTPIKLMAPIQYFAPRIIYPSGVNIGTNFREDNIATHPIVGPAKIVFNDRWRRDVDSNMLFVYDLQKTTTSASSPSLPSNTVVIPTDASGPVEIVMESSKDLVNWTRAEPGTYGADTPKRFFRIRAVVKP
jgi:hypothetical protein